MAHVISYYLSLPQSLAHKGMILGKNDHPKENVGSLTPVLTNPEPVVFGSRMFLSCISVYQNVKDPGQLLWTAASVLSPWEWMFQGALSLLRNNPKLRTPSARRGALSLPKEDGALLADSGR